MDVNFVEFRGGQNVVCSRNRHGLRQRYRHLRSTVTLSERGEHVVPPRRKRCGMRYVLRRSNRFVGLKRPARRGAAGSAPTEPQRPRERRASLRDFVRVEFLIARNLNIHGCRWRGGQHQRWRFGGECTSHRNLLRFNFGKLGLFLRRRRGRARFSRRLRGASKTTREYATRWHRRLFVGLVKFHDLNYRPIRVRNFFHRIIRHRPRRYALRFAPGFGSGGRREL
mmetsp:Transcript_3276/g.12247  ORF Transcript_3276/g.12247 Transcript_3276/m.12247 type:complete len:225 (+) Transcript_3276:1641-2315(+)